MAVVGIVFAVVLWLMAGATLSVYEMDVRVLRPWQRALYGAVAFAAGICIIVASLRAGR